MNEHHELTNVTERALRIDDVASLTGLSRATVRRLDRAGAFPPGRRLGPGAVRWLASELAQWLRTRPAVNGSGRVAP